MNETDHKEERIWTFTLRENGLIRIEPPRYLTDTTINIPAGEIISLDSNKPRPGLIVGYFHSAYTHYPKPPYGDSDEFRPYQRRIRQRAIDYIVFQTKPRPAIFSDTISFGPNILNLDQWKNLCVGNDKVEEAVERYVSCYLEFYKGRSHSALERIVNSRNLYFQE